MLASETVSAASAARFVLASADKLPQGLSPAEAELEAYGAAASRGWINRAAGENMTLKDTAFLVMNAFEIKGGLFYSLFRNPRYAYRELIYRKIIQGRSDPAMAVSGERFLRILGRVLDYVGGEGGFN